MATEETPSKHYRIGLLAGEVRQTALADGEIDSVYVQTLLAVLNGIGCDAPLGVTLESANAAWKGTDDSD